jgi:hypothetical protein
MAEKGCSSSFGWGCGAIVIIIIIAGIIGAIINPNKNINKTELNQPSDKLITKVIDNDPTAKLSNLNGEERQYVIKSYQYLYNMYQKAQDINRIGEMARNKSTNMDEIHKVLESARMAHISAWNEIKDLPVPNKFKMFDKKLRIVSNMLIKALDEQLQYFQDNRLVHIKKGGDMFTKAVSQLISCIKEQTKLLDSYKTKPQD